MGSSRKTEVRFRQTSWSLIVSARDNRADLETLLTRYWSPVYAYLRRSGHKPADAEDLTQAFLSTVVLGRDMIGRADPTKGRFRSFLIAALSRFVVDEYRREHGRDGKRAPTFIPDDPNALSAAEPSQEDDPARAFDRQWALIVLEAALGRVAEACRKDGMERQWTAFEARILRPARGHDPAPIEELMKAVEASSAQEVYSMLQTVKRKIDRELREVVAETVEDESDVERELGELRNFLVSSR